MRLVVISTGRGQMRRELDRNLWEQSRRPDEVTYVQWDALTPPRSQTENWIEMAGDLGPDDIVAIVDGDDALCTEYALARVYEEHLHGAWVTYGSFVYDDGAMGFAAPVVGDPRKAPWTATHLKTMRAGLLHRIKPEDLSRRHATDLAVMLPALEMAGHARSVFVPEPLYVYTRGTSFEASASEVEKAEEAADVAWIRAREPYARLETL